MRNNDYNVYFEADYGSVEGYDIPAIPDRFKSGAADDKFFTPATDHYKIIMVEMKDREFTAGGWIERFGTWEFPYQVIGMVHIIQQREIKKSS